MRANPYETAQYLREYLLFHYGRPGELCPFPFVPRELLRFHGRILEECMLPIAAVEPTRGLDLGCGVGRFTFELGRVVDQVLGIDNSKLFIRAARRMARGEPLRLLVKESGTHATAYRLTLAPALRQSNVEFRVGDALELSATADRSYHVISAINLLDRLPQPRRLLEALPRLLAPGGQLILASPFTWMTAYTPSRKWLTFEEVRNALRPSLRLARRRDLPFLIREHRRKYQLVISNVATFVRAK